MVFADKLFMQIILNESTNSSSLSKIAKKAVINTLVVCTLHETLTFNTFEWTNAEQYMRFQLNSNNKRFNKHLDFSVLKIHFLSYVLDYLITKNLNMDILF